MFCVTLDFVDDETVLDLPPSAVTEITSDSAPLVPRETRQLTPRQQKRAARLLRMREIDEEIKWKASQVMNAAMDARLIGDNDDKPEGWSETRFRVAKDARRFMKIAPGYLGMAKAVWESYRKAEADKKPQPQINVTTVYVDKATTIYPTKVVDAE